MFRPAKPIVKSQEGIALALTILVMGLLLLLGTALLSISSTETQIAFNERDGLQAFYLAEAGVERAIAELNDTPNYTGTAGEAAFGSGTYTAAVTTPAGSTIRRVINATGCVPNCAAPAPARKQIQVTVERISPFRWPLFGDERVNLDDVVVTDSYNSDRGPYGAPIVGGSPSLNLGSEGDVGSNGDIELDKGVIIKGDVIASGKVKKEALAQVTGQVVEGEAKHPLTPVEKTHCDLAKEHKDRLEVKKGEVVTIGPGTYYYDRIKIEQGAVVEVSGEANIFVDGQVQIKEGAVVGIKPGAVVLEEATAGAGQAVGQVLGKGEGKDKDKLTVTPDLLQPPAFFTVNSCSNAEARLEEGVVFSGVIYAPKAHVDVKKVAIVYGSLIGKRVEVDDGVLFHYDEALRGKSPGKFRPMAGTWQELFPIDGGGTVAGGPQYPTSPTKTP